MKPRRPRTAPGFTIVELIVTMTILSVLLTSLVGVLLPIQRGYLAQREQARAQESLRTAQFVIVTVLRTAGADALGTGSALLDPDPLGHGSFDNLRVVSDFNPADGDVADALEDVTVWLASDTLLVRWSAGGSDQALSYPINDLRFQYYADDGTLLTTPLEVVSASSVRVSLEAPREPGSSLVERTESWVYLRNRQ